MHPGDKKSFKIDFNKFISGQNYDGLKKLNFSNGFKDPTCMREKLFFDVCRQVGVPGATGQLRRGDVQRRALGLLHHRGAD